MKKTKAQKVIENKRIVELEEQLKEANKAANYEREQRLILKGKNERYEKEEDEETAMIADRQHQEFSSMQDQIQWLRGLIEDLVMPKDKFEILQQRREITMSSGEYPRPIYNPERRRNYR